MNPYSACRPNPTVAGWVTIMFPKGEVKRTLYCKYSVPAFFGYVRKMSECFGQCTNEHISDRINENHPVTIFRVAMAGTPGKGGVKGKSGPPGNQNAFRHGLGAIEARRTLKTYSRSENSIRSRFYRD
jgi:hypothetical protein